jgi:hypothetical protein
MTGREEEIERRLEQSKCLLKHANDPTTKDRIRLLIGDLEQEQKLKREK